MIMLPRCASVCAVLCGLSAFWGLSGCAKSSTPAQALNQALNQAGKSKVPVYPLAGKVMIDGRPPQTGRRQSLLMVLYDPQQPQLPAGARPHAECDEEDGSFAFTTYQKGDGVPVGKYIIAFVELKESRQKGYVGPDLLQNLYNDPDKNAEIVDFKITHDSPGKKDYAFNLKLEGMQSVAAGSKAITHLD
jgi:hypothetical protein